MGSAFSPESSTWGPDAGASDPALTPADAPLVIVLLGATASGKTDLAIAIAEAFDLAVLSVDSRQIYTDMDIGTAKASAAQRAQVRHRLLDLRPPDRPMNLQEFRAEAEAAIAAEHARRGVAFLVGAVASISRRSPRAWSHRPCRPNPSCGPSSRPWARPGAIRSWPRLIP